MVKHGYQKTCSVAGCTRLVGRNGARGMCSAHLKRSYRKGDMSKPLQRKGEGWDHSEGYRYLGTRGYHRQVMERVLGRRLTFNEVVHHIDGDKRNNSPSNLRVMDRGDHIRLHTAGKTNEQRKLEKENYGVVLTPEMKVRKP